MIPRAIYMVFVRTIDAPPVCPDCTAIQFLCLSNGERISREQAYWRAFAGSMIHSGSEGGPVLTAVIRGEEGRRVLAGLRVGVAGVGGVGSILVEFLARLGVGGLVLVDYDVLKEENLNRSLGARREDVGRPKIEYLARVARLRHRPRLSYGDISCERR